MVGHEQLPIRDSSSSFPCTGMKTFLTEYVFVRKIPITRLLYAFGISLVRTFRSFEFSVGTQRAAKCKELRQKHPNTQMYFLKVVIFQV